MLSEPIIVTHLAQKPLDKSCKLSLLDFCDTENKNVLKILVRIANACVITKTTAKVSGQALACV